LSRDGYRIVVGLGGGEGCTEFSRFVDESWEHPPLAGDGKAFLTHLLTTLEERPDISVVYPVAEEFVRFLAEQENLLPPRIVLASPPGRVVRTCCDKIKMYRVAKDCGVDHQPVRAAHTLDEGIEAAREIGFPIVIRPLGDAMRLGHKKALIVPGWNELLELFEQWPFEQTRLLFQRYAKGERQDVFFAARYGRILRSLQVRYLRTDHIEGTGLCVHGEVQAVSDKLLEHCSALVAGLDYTGIGCAQFVIEPKSGKACFLELNPRTSAIHRVPEAMGMELSQLAIALAAGTIPTALQRQFQYPAGQRYAWTYGDLRGIKSALRTNEIGMARAAMWALQAIQSAITADFHLTWRRDDPLPTIKLFLQQLGLGGVTLSRKPRSPSNVGATNRVDKSSC
jgi:biotin carboxylase